MPINYVSKLFSKDLILSNTTLVMKIIEGLFRIILGQYEDNDNENIENFNEIQGHEDKNLECEKKIIQCQITNDQLLGSTSQSLRKKYGNHTVDKAIRRLAQRRKRGKCSRKAEIEKTSKFLKPIVDYYFKKHNENGL